VNQRPRRSGRHRDVEDQDRDGDSEDPVAEVLDPTLVNGFSLTQLETLDVFEIASIPSHQGHPDIYRGGGDHRIGDLGAVMPANESSRLGDGALDRYLDHAFQQRLNLFIAVGTSEQLAPGHNRVREQASA
jgi:hypothetical protein